MGVWAWYFFGKLYLAATGAIGLHVLANLALAAALAWPLPQGRRWPRVLRQVVALPLGIALLYYDSWLPPMGSALARASALRDFSPAYLAELAGRFIDLRTAAVVAGIGLAVWLLGRKLRLATFVFAGLLLAALLQQLPALSSRSPATVPQSAQRDTTTAALPAATPAVLDAELDAFYARESQRRVNFPSNSDSAAPFDLLILHICSLASDDLDYAGLPEHPFLSQATLQLRRFNTAASYSGPAAARLLQSGCGQTPEAQLYKPQPPECLLVNGLKSAGFTPQLALNHDGHFDDFLGVLRERGGWSAAPIDHSGVPVYQHAFDGSPLYGDYDMLAHWWQQRVASDVPQVALYYNSLSLHDGNRVDGQRFDSSRDSYRLRAQRLFDDLQRFSELVRDSGRRAVIVLLPEHGANLRGDRQQISGLREIPSPAITQAPAVLHLVNLPQPPQSAGLRIDRSVSLFGLSSLLAELTRQNPFDNTSGPLDLSRYANAAAETQPVLAENDRTLLMQRGEQWWMRTPDGVWSEYGR